MSSDTMPETPLSSTPRTTLRRHQELPIAVTFGAPLPDPEMPSGAEVPAHSRGRAGV